MGYDIHDYVEVWDGQQWTWMQDPLWETWRGEPTCHPLDRCYDLFGFLAGVRATYMPYIHAPRGLPRDLSPELKREFGFTFPDDCPHPPVDPPPRYGPLRSCSCVYHDSGLFGHSWASGAELLAFDYSTTLMCPSYHGDEGLTALRCQGTDGHRVTVAERLGGWRDTLLEVARLRPDPSHVRLVYAFDN